MSVMASVLNVAIVLAVAPLLQGVIVKIKAAVGGRVGAPLLQWYYDIWKLLHKGAVYSRTTTWVFLAGPVVGVCTSVLAAFFVPMVGHSAIFHFEGDLLLVVYLFALARFFVAAAALDTGSPFEGMGAAREVTYASLAEPALFLAMLTPAHLAGGSASLSTMLGPSLELHWSDGTAAVLLAGVSLFAVLLVEACRIPFDDPNTHLELTMIHEVMVLDHGGPALGAILYSASLKMALLGVLVIRLLIPWSTGWVLLDTLLLCGELLLVGVLVGVVESVIARLRLPEIPKVLVGACLMAAFGLVLTLR